LIVLSHYQVKKLLHCEEKRKSVRISLDLGRSEDVVMLGDEISFPNGERLTWEMVDQISADENSCFLVESGEATKIQEYSNVFNRVYTLYPTESAPTMLVSGIPMHRIKDVTPWEDTRNKIKAFGRIRGHVLDTATGLGYTAILASEYASHVTTVELDPIVQLIAKRNPWSFDLFDNPKITQLIGDANDVILKFEGETFDGIIHDPPMFSMAGELYSSWFYRQIHRILKPGGCMFHYIGNPRSKSGSRTTRSVVMRLKQVGFSTVFSRPNAFGVLACK
jgi:predicted methyltransferase